MKKHISYPSIEQFRHIVASINRKYNFVGLDENGEAIYDETKDKPTLTFKGTVKLHGGNGGVCYNDTAGLWVQSRETIITPENDNYGFAAFVEKHKSFFIKLFNKISYRSDIDLSKNTVTIFGEWCGKGIQKGVAINNLTKSFFIFGVKVTPFNNHGENISNSFWVDSTDLSFVFGFTDLNNAEIPVFNIDDFMTYSIEIDFNKPELFIDKLSELTLAVEQECPVAKAFGYSGVGEGIVWSAELDGVIYRFKVKGEKHSVTKVKKIADVDVEKIASVNEFVEYTVTESRFNQGIEKVFPNGENIDTKKLGELMKWVVNDIIKEESDTLVKNNLTNKDVNKQISNKVREMFFNCL